MVIVLLDNTSIDAQVSVYHAAFNKLTSIEETKEKWIKKHYKNPIESSLIFGAYEGKELVGLNAYLPSCYTINSKKVYLLQSCESGVLPSHQGKGIWGKIVRYAVDYITNNTRYVGIIGFPNFKTSYPGFKKMGWKTLYEMNNMILINNAKVFSQSISNGRKFYQCIALFSALQRIPVNVYALFYNDIIVEECEITDVIWNDVGNKMSIDHFDEWCLWKVDYKHIRCFSLIYRGKALAYCIYDIGNYEGNEVIRLNYFSIVPQINISSKVLISKLLKYLKKCYPKAVFVRVWTMNNTILNCDLKKLFFLRSSHSNPFIITESKSDLAEKEWSLSFFDLD